MTAINYIDVRSSVKKQCLELRDQLGKSDLEERVNNLFTGYLELMDCGCYSNAKDFYKVIQGGVASFDPALVKEVDLVQKAAKAFLTLHEEGLRHKELAVKQPEEGPRLKHWFVLYLDELNVAVAEGDVDKIKAVMQNIFYMQEKLKEIGGSEETKNLSALCDARIEEIDPEQAFREEIRSWSKWMVSNVAKPMGLTALVASSVIVPMALHVGIKSGVDRVFGSEIGVAGIAAGSAMGFFRSARSANLVGMTSSAFIFSAFIIQLNNQLASYQVQQA